MLQGYRELWLAFIAILLITLLYLFIGITFQAIPAASGVFGHSLGILGFLLMFMTETLYSLRKRSRSARWGRMADWLQFHIFTGIVGPYLVLIHSSWKFHGLAGLLTLMTVIIVASGFIGRYIFTAIPRSVDGVELESDELERQILSIETELASLRAVPAAGSSPSARQATRRLKALTKRRKAVVRQVASLAMTRRLLSLWHTVHIPLGLALFATAFVHIGAAIYYATLLR